MATTSEAKRNVENVVYAEDDKLGPLGGKRSVIDDPAELRRVLVGEFRSAADAARDAAAAIDQNATTAVHEYRKALRRARAVLSLLAESLPRNEHKAVRRALRDARRSLSSARDHAVAPEAVTESEPDGEKQATIKPILMTAVESVPPIAEIKQLLAEGAARAAAQVEALEAALPPTVTWSSVLHGVRDVYKRARRARKDAKSSKRSFHEWRRRTKELACQLDVICSYTGPGVGELQDAFVQAGESQGVVVDLIMLRDFAQTHGAAVAPEFLDALVERINKEISELAKESRRGARDVFSRRPRRFAKKVAKAAHSDSTPVENRDDLA